MDRSAAGIVRLHCFRKRSQNLFDDPPVPVQGHRQDKIVKRTVDPVDDIHIEGLRTDNPAVHLSFFKKPFRYASDKNPENVADPEMHPFRILSSFLRRYLRLAGRERNPCFFPAFPVLQAFPCQIHTVSSLITGSVYAYYIRSSFLTEELLFMAFLSWQSLIISV